MIYEELGHALQYHRDGHVEVGSINYYKREIEVAECLLERVSKYRIELSVDEVKQTELNLKAYQEKLRNLEG